MRLRLILAACATLTLAACASAPKLDTMPQRAFVPEQFFKGRTYA
ncbi:MAG: hypothetical protein RIQ68_2269, partial [Pseudomonadota bacterium]